MLAPLIPCINEAEIEKILEAAKEHGATSAGYVLLRLPYDLKDIFHEWLLTHFPDRAVRAINTMRSMRGGLDYDADWFKRGRGEGTIAKLITSRFHKATNRLDLRPSRLNLRTDLFQKPGKEENQMSLGL